MRLAQYFRSALVVATMTFAGVAAAATPLGLPPLQYPPDNPPTPAKIQLGSELFHDARFSSTGEIACKNCHLDGIAFHDGRTVPKGVHNLPGTRNAPTVVNAAYLTTLFWDGRVGSLEQQAVQPLFNPVEQGLHGSADVLRVLRDDPAYVAKFRAVFGVDAQHITLDMFAKAIACYERTLISGNSPFDRWYYGGEADALSMSAQRGFKVFTGQGQCSACHTVSQKYALFTDDKFHNVNVGFGVLGKNPQQVADAYLRAKQGGGNVDHQVLSDKVTSELGRFAVSGKSTDLGAFKTPTLRNIDRTGPYLHNGKLRSLDAVVDYFNNGGKLRPTDPGPNPFQSPLVRPLHLSAQQKQDLVAFLESLTSPEYEPPVYSR